MVVPSQPIPGFATPEGTARHAEAHARHPDAFSHVAGLSLSTLGLGTYLGAATAEIDAAYVQAVTSALRSGINVIDTASNYRCQRSERAVGHALRDLCRQGMADRDGLLVASKAGFVPFASEPPPDIPAWLRAQTIGRGLCREDELVAGCHCMAPAYLTDMLGQSRERLGLGTLDVYFVHNPETQLQVLPLAEVEARLRRAFEALEAAADRGEIRAYGIATWSALRALPGERDHLELARVVRLAEEVAGRGHRCKAVQLPLNLAMTEALRRANQTVHGRTMTALQAAAELDMLVFASGTLQQGRLARPHPCVVTARAEVDRLGPVGTALQFARSAPGVTTALCGMANPQHVLDNTAVLDLARASPAWLERTCPQRAAAAWP